MKSISMIIPTYNCEQYIDQCIRSVVIQKGFNNCELILVDDGSSDQTAQCLKKWEAYPNIKILTCDHQGVSHARNEGLKYATGEFIMFMDSDDTIQENCFEEIENSLIHSDLDLIIFGINYVDEVNRYLSAQWTLNNQRFENGSEYAEVYIRCRNLLLYSNCNKVYRNRLIRRHSICFQEGLQFGEDRLFNFRYLSVCGSIQCLSGCYYCYYHRQNDSLSQKYVPGFAHITGFLFFEKLQCITSLAPNASDNELKAFEVNDACFELANIKNYIQSHYSRLSYKERYRECEAILTTPMVRSIEESSFKLGKWSMIVKSASKIHSVRILMLYFFITDKIRTK